MTAARPLHLAVASRAVAPQHGYGGLERATAHHLRALARRGARLTVFTQPPDPRQPPPDDFAGQVTWRTIPYHRRLPLRANSIPDRLLHYAPFSRALGRAIAALCRAERVDVVHAHGLTALGYAEQAGGPAPLPPLVLNPHGLEEFSGRNRAKWLAYAPFRRGLRRAARAAAAIIATDRALVGPVERQLWVPPGRIVTIPNGVDVAELDAWIAPGLVRDLRDRHGLDASPLTMVSVARLEQNKGLDDGLAALALLGGRLPRGWRWLIVGGGSAEAELRAAIGRLGLAANVTLVGALPDPEVHSLLECADLVLVPSRYEGSSLVALEAMAHRLPLVATTAGGLPDKVLPGRTGFLAAPGDPAAYATALAAALAARPTWAALGAAARALVETTFSWSALADRYLALYEDLARGA